MTTSRSEYLSSEVSPPPHPNSPICHRPFAIGHPPHARHARGSTGETHYQLCLAGDLGYIEELKYQELKEKVERVGRLLSGLISSIQKNTSR